VDSGLHEISERGIDHPLPIDAIFACKGRAFDAQGEMALACRVVAAVPAMLLAVVDKLDRRW